ncbi:hypothetical protein Tco_1437571 [Tanacetum coccineum]
MLTHLEKSISGKLDLVLYRAVAYTEHSFHLLKPLNQLDNSFCAFEIQRLALHEVWVSALSSNSFCSSNTCSQNMAVIAIHASVSITSCQSGSNALVNHCLKLGINDRCGGGCCSSHNMIYELLPASPGASGCA